MWYVLQSQVHVSKPTDPEFRGMNGGLGVYGVMTEFLMQMTPPSYTTLITSELPDTNMLADVQKMLKTSPHILVFWRPDIEQYRAFQVRGGR